MHCNAAACTRDSTKQQPAHQTQQYSCLHTRHYNAAACTPDTTMQCSCLHTRHYNAAACTPDTAMQLLAHQTLQCSCLHTRHYHVAACTPDITMQPPAHQTLQCSRLHTRHYNAFTWTIPCTACTQCIPKYMWLHTYSVTIKERYNVERNCDPCWSFSEFLCLCVAHHIFFIW